MLVPVAAWAQGANYVRKGFAFPKEHRAKILVAYPDWFIGKLTSKGESAVIPEWLALTVANTNRALSNGPVGKVADLEFMTAIEAHELGDLKDVWASFRPRTGELVSKVAQGTEPGAADSKKPYPKGKKGYYEYNIGLDSIEKIKALHPASDYLLLIGMHDAYATFGQKVGSIAAGTAEGFFQPLGSAPGRAAPPHFGNSMLIDLKDGAVVWYHGDGAFGGDPRTPDGAVKRMGQAMERFPGTTPRP